MADPAPRSAKGLWFLALAVVLSLGTAIAGLVHQQRSLHTVRGTPQQTLIVDGTAGPAVVLVDAVEARLGRRNARSAYRVAARELGTGRQLGDQLFDTKVECAAASAGRLWCWDPQANVTSLDVSTMTIAGRADELLHKAGIAAPIAPGRVVVRRGDLYVLLTDGKAARIDSATLTVQPDPGEWPRREWPPTPSLQVGDVPLRFGDGPRHALKRLDPRDRVAPPPSGAPLFLSDLPTPAFFRPAADVLLIDHVTSLDPEVAHRQLSRVDGTPRVLWTVELPCKLPPTVAAHGDDLVIATSDPALRVMVVDATTGLPRWQH